MYTGLEERGLCREPCIPAIHGFAALRCMVEPLEKGTTFLGAYPRQMEL